MTQIDLLPQTGKRLSDNSYWWVCECNYVCPEKVSQCPYCCGLEIDRVIESLKTAQGTVYYQNLRAFLTLKGKEIYDDAIAIKSRTNRFTPTDLLSLVDKHGLPRNRTKIVTEWLEETGFLPTGTYEMMRDRGFQPTKAN